MEKGNNGLYKKSLKLCKYGKCKITNRLQISEAKCKCQECLHAHSLRSGLFVNTMLPEKVFFVVIVRSVNDFNVIEIHVVIMSINMLGNL